MKPADPAGNESRAAMPPIALNRRRFLGCSAAASLALSQGAIADSADGESTATPIRLGLIGVGNRGTALLRILLDSPGISVVSVADPEPKHQARAAGISEKASGKRPITSGNLERLLERPEVDAVVIAVPCDVHESIALAALRAGKHVYLEKPMAISIAACDRLIAETHRLKDRVVQVGFQRRANPRFIEGIDLIRGGEIGPLLEARASWTSSNGPLTGHAGWLSRRERSGDFMVEQAVHVWDVLRWLKDELPVAATGWGRSGLFASQDPARDVTDHYAVELEWTDGFRASFHQSYVAPADDAFTGSILRVMGEQGGFDFGTGALTYRDRGRGRLSVHPGPQNDTRLSLLSFLASIRGGGSPPLPISLREARDATLIGLLARRAVDERRSVRMDELDFSST